MKTVYSLLAMVFVIFMTWAAAESYADLQMSTLERTWLTLKWFIAFGSFAGIATAAACFLEERRWR